MVKALWGTARRAVGDNAEALWGSPASGDWAVDGLVVLVMRCDPTTAGW